jgi:hypothetical protein
LDIFLAANLIRKPAVCAWLSRLSLDDIPLYRFDLINPIFSPGQAAARETGDRIERETHLSVPPLALLADVLGPFVQDRSAVETGLGDGFAPARIALPPRLDAL